MTANRQAVYDLAAELSMAAAALVYACDTPERWDDFTAYATERAGIAPPRPRTREEAVAVAARLVAMARAAMHEAHPPQNGAGS